MSFAADKVRGASPLPFSSSSSESSGNSRIEAVETYGKVPTMLNFQSGLAVHLSILNWEKKETAASTSKISAEKAFNDLQLRATALQPWSTTRLCQLYLVQLQARVMPDTLSCSRWSNAVHPLLLAKASHNDRLLPP